MVYFIVLKTLKQTMLFHVNTKVPTTRLVVYQGYCLECVNGVSIILVAKDKDINVFVVTIHDLLCNEKYCRP